MAVLSSPHNLPQLYGSLMISTKFTTLWQSYYLHKIYHNFMAVLSSPQNLPQLYGSLMISTKFTTLWQSYYLHKITMTSWQSYYLHKVYHNFMAVLINLHKIYHNLMAVLLSPQNSTATKERNCWR